MLDGRRYCGAYIRIYMNKNILLIILLCFKSISIYSETYISTLIPKIDKIYSELTRYNDFRDELNINTVENTIDNTELFGEDFIDFTVKENDYCSLVKIDGISQKTYAMMEVSGSGRFPYLYIFTYDPLIKKIKLIYQFNDKYVIPIEYKGSTFFLEIVTKFDNKRLQRYNLLALNNGQWNLIESINLTYYYNLSNEDTKWISSERIEQLANFDYSFIGYKEDHPNKITYKLQNKLIQGQLYYTSVGYMASNYEIEILENDKQIENLGSQWGFFVTYTNGKPFLVYIGMGEEPGEERVSSIESFYLNVIDLGTMEKVYRNYIKAQIHLNNE